MDKFEKREFYTVVAGGAYLSTVAGYLNALSLMGIFNTTVSHVTGTVTRLSIGIASGQESELVLRQAASWLSFAAGAFISGWLVGGSDQRFRLGRNYYLVLVTESLMLLLAYLLLLYNQGIFEEQRNTPKQVPVSVLWRLSFLVSAACGLQNAMASSYSGAVLRTTHMTGLTTDIATLSAQYLRARLFGTPLPETWRLFVFIPLFLGFFFGGMLAVFCFQWMNVHALLVAVFLIAGLAVFYFSSRAVDEARKFMFIQEAKERAQRLRAQKDMVMNRILTRLDSLMRAETEKQATAEHNNNATDYSSDDGLNDNV